MQRRHFQLSDEYAAKLDQAAAADLRPVGNWVAKLVMRELDAGAAVTIRQTDYTLVDE